MLNACPTPFDFDFYQPRNPKASAYYRCVEDHFEQLETVWDERYQNDERDERGQALYEIMPEYLRCRI